MQLVTMARLKKKKKKLITPNFILEKARNILMLQRNLSLYCLQKTSFIMNGSLLFPSRPKQSHRDSALLGQRLKLWKENRAIGYSPVLGAMILREGPLRNLFYSSLESRESVWNYYYSYFLLP